jgi:hypothetical protein
MRVAVFARWPSERNAHGGVVAAPHARAPKCCSESMLLPSGSAPSVEASKADERFGALFMQARATCVSLLAGCVLAGCRGESSRPVAGVDLYDAEEQAVRSVEYRTAGQTVIAVRRRDGFAHTVTNNATSYVITCRSSISFDRAIRSLFKIHGIRMLSASEVDRLRRTVGREDGWLRIQDIAARVGGPIEPVSWNIYPNFGGTSPVVAIDASAHGTGEAWEVDISKDAIRLLRGGCGGLGGTGPVPPRDGG